uniref:Uncharacterized protein n=1 Tax=Lotharella globosa TaxID=91324 RepID=A0A6V3LDU0_9EUKA
MASASIRRPNTFEELKLLKPSHKDFEDIWDVDEEARMWWKENSGKDAKLKNEVLTNLMVDFFEKKYNQPWPKALVRKIVDECIDLRTPTGVVDETDFRCFINMWGPMNDILKTVTRSIYDTDGNTFPFWAGKKGREHRFQNIGDYVIRFATSRFHLAASWKKVKAGSLVIKHVAVWRCPRGFYWVPQTNGPFVGYFATLRDLVRDFDHTLRNPGCSELWYESTFTKRWYSPADSEKKATATTESQSIYVMLDDKTIDQHKKQAEIKREEMLKEAQNYYIKNKKDEDCYPWDSACSPTVFGGFFRAMLPSRALGVESTPRLDNGFSDSDFEADKRAREMLSRKKLEKKKLQVDDIEARIKHLKNSSSTSCRNLVEKVPQFMRQDSCAQAIQPVDEEKGARQKDTKQKGET